jgi:hypothetical protein
MRAKRSIDAAAGSAKLYTFGWIDDLLDRPNALPREGSPACAYAPLLARRWRRDFRVDLDRRQFFRPGRKGPVRRLARLEFGVRYLVRCFSRGAPPPRLCRRSLDPDRSPSRQRQRGIAHARANAGAGAGQCHRREWNLITRWILPVIAQAPLTITGDREFGLGDLNPSFFFSPKKPTGGIIWGVGPTLLAPTGPIRLPSCSRWSLLFPWVRTP